MKTILIVEDEEIIREIIATMLNPSYNLLEASNGQEALTVCERHNPDLVITDLHMPVMNGVEFVKRLRSSHSEIKIVAISSSFHHPQDPSYISMMKAGTDICLPKPLDRDKLSDSVDHLLGLDEPQ
ncbi:MAG: response regulator [Acidobacteriota bacterium]